MHRILIGTTILAAFAANAQTSSPATRTYEAVTGNSPADVSRLRITPVDAASFAVDFSIVAPNPSGHGGHLQGLATMDGARLVLRVPNFREGGLLDHPPLCTIVIDVGEARATVVSAHQCTGFHGAAASFVEQGQNLLRVR